MSSSRPKGRAASQRPTSRSKRAQKPRHQPPSLVHLLEFDAGGLNFASELCGFVGVDVLDRLEAVSGGAKRAVGLSPISLALTAKEEAAPLAAVLAAHEDAKHLKDHVRTLKTQMEEQDVRWSKIERDQAVYDCEVAPLREKLKEAEYQLKVQEKNHEAEVLELKLEHAQEISEWKAKLALAMAWTGQIPKPAKEEDIFVDPSAAIF